MTERIASLAMFLATATILGCTSPGLPNGAAPSRADHAREPIHEVIHEATRVEPSSRPSSDPPPKPTAPPSTREIADRAGAYTVFLRSGGAYGAGILFDATRILTCNHVVLGDRVEVYFEGAHAPLMGTTIERDPELDLALVRVTEPLPSHAQSATLSGIDRISTLGRGDEVYAMGAPRKMQFSFHRGVVSYNGRSFDSLYYLQTDLAMSPGSSGGPVLNQWGRIVGIASFILRGEQGLSFALPIDYALRRFPSLDPERDETLRRAQRDGFERWLTAHAAGSPLRDGGGQAAPAAAADVQ